MGISTKRLVENYTGILYPRAEIGETVEHNMQPGHDGPAGNPASVIDGGVSNTSNTNTFSFSKKFNFNIKSTKLQYKKTISSATSEYGGTLIITYVHSLPYQMLYFYLTEKEFNDMRSINHTARVCSASIKIVNLGNRTPFVTGQNTVSFANANSQTTIGIWENLENIGPITLGKNITAETLYGKILEDLPEAATTDMDKTLYGATSQSKPIDNKISYEFVTERWKNKSRQKLNDGNFYIPGLLMQAGILYNATNSIGEIYSKSYTPKDGTFHKYNNAWYNVQTGMRAEGNPHEINLSTGNITDFKLTRVASNHKVSYDTATIDNVMFSGLEGGGSTSIGASLGIGIVPLLNNDDTLHNTYCVDQIQ